MGGSAETRTAEVSGHALELRRSEHTWSSLRPGVVVALAIALTLVVYGGLAQLAPSPWVFDDELIYWSTAGSLAGGEGLQARGAEYPYGFAFLYPSLLAPILRAAPDRVVAYELAQLLNSLLWVLAAVPIYLLARRLLPPWSSVGVAVISIMIPSARYVSGVMTEALAYVLASSALYAMARSLERPTLGRHAFSLAAILVACTARVQFVVLLPAYVLALVLGALLLPSEHRARRASRSQLATLLGGALVLGLGALLLLPALRGGSASDALGGYAALWGSYDLVGVARWLVYHVGNLGLYLAVVPLAVAPIVLASYAARARAGSERHGAFVALFVSVSCTVLLLAAAFDSTEHGLGRLHDRYVFYVVPLWLVVLFAWLDEGAPRPRVATGVGAALALLFVGLLPASVFDAGHGGKLFDGVATTLWAAVEAALGGGPFMLRGSLLLFASMLVAAVLFLPCRLVWLIPSVVAGMLLLSSALAWSVAVDDSRRVSNEVFGGDRRWVERRVPANTSVTTLFAPCGNPDLARAALFQTEFFNPSLGNATHVLDGFAYLLVSSPIQVAAGGALILPSGATLVADHIVIQPGVRVRGRRVGEGTNAHLVLWDVGGPVRVAGVRTAAELRRAACATRADS